MIEPPAEEFQESNPPITVEPPAELPPDVSYVVPASAYDSIATDGEPARAAEPPPPTILPVLDLSPALEAIEALGSKLDALGAAFEREGRAEASREKIVDRLHAELQEYKQDLVLSLMKPVFLDLIQLHDDVGKMAATLQDSAHDESVAPALLANVQQGIEDILYRQGVEPFSTDRDEFDARRQRAIATVATDDPDLARKVAGRLRRGFTSGERIIRPEVVSVFAVRRT